MAVGTSARESLKEMKRLKNEPLLLLAIIVIIAFVGLFVVYPVIKVILFPDGATYMELFELMMSLVRLPDLLIYLKSSIPHLVGQIQKRGREYEKGISIEYLTGLNEKYEQWISGYEGEILTIDADNLDFENRPEDFSLITDMIDARLYGLF